MANSASTSSSMCGSRPSVRATRSRSAIPSITYLQAWRRRASEEACDVRRAIELRNGSV